MVVISVTVTASTKRSAKYQSTTAEVSLTANLRHDEDLRQAIWSLSSMASETASCIAFEDLNAALAQMAQAFESPEGERGGRIIGGGAKQ